MTDLRFAPWITEDCSKGVLANRPARPSESVESHIGLVVQLKLVQDNQRALGVIIDVTISEKVRWYWILTKGLGRWLHERQVCDWEPVCPYCQARRWWWTEEGAIYCATCYPPAPDWRDAWHLLAALTHGYLPQDEQTKIVLGLLETADHAYGSKDWPTFQRVTAQLQAHQPSG